MTRVVCDVGQPRRMETCGAEEPYEGNLHVRFCGGIGRVIADPTRTEPRPEPDSGKPTVRDRRGACGTVNHGGTRHPLHNRKGAERKLSTYRCARRISIPTTGTLRS